MKLKFTLAAVLSALFCWACSNAESSSAGGEETSKNEAAVSADSTRVLVYSYDKFLSKKDLTILDADTSRISVDEGFARSIDKDLPRKGNVLVVWDNIKRPPFYLRVASVKEDAGRVVLDVDKATPFEALPPNSDVQFSSELFIDAEQLNTNGAEDIDNAVFYDKSNATYHPAVVYQQQDEEDENEESIGLMQSNLSADDDIFVDGVLDLREVLKTNIEINKKYTLADYDVTFHPGAVSIPGLGSFNGDYMGSYKTLFKDGVKGLDKAFRENAGASYQPGVAGDLTAYIRVDSLRLQNKVDFHLGFKTTWYLAPRSFDLKFYTKGTYEISNIGIGLGNGISGEKQLTHWKGLDFIFYVGPVPVAISFKPNIYFKYNLEVFGMFNYDWGYKYTMNDTVGFEWNSGKGFNNIKKVHHESTYNKAENFYDFVSKTHFLVEGHASMGLYLRMPIMFYYAAGPTVGVGFRGDVESQIGGSILYDGEGGWEKFEPSGHVKLDAAIPLEMGGQVDILGVTVFKRAYDVWDIKSWNLFDLNTEDYK